MSCCCRHGSLLRPQTEARSRLSSLFVKSNSYRPFSTSDKKHEELSAASRAKLKTGKKKKGTARVHRVDIASDTLCDDIKQRLSNTLTVNKPSVILDLYPGPGILSSKINELVRPYRHILVEPRVSLRYRKHLDELRMRDKEHIRIHKEKVDYGSRYGIGWSELLDTHLPAELPSGMQRDLLVIANLTDSAFKNAARVWAALVGHSLLNRGCFSDWTIRTLMIFPPDEAESIIPRSSRNRRKVAILNEAYSRQSFVVAETDNTKNIIPRGYELVEKSASMVAQRMEADQIFLPPHRIRGIPESYAEVPAGLRTEAYTAKYPLFVGEPFKEFLEKKDLYEGVISSYFQTHGGTIIAELTHAMSRTRVVHIAKKLAKTQLDLAQLKSIVQGKLNAADFEEAKKYKEMVRKNPRLKEFVQRRREFFRVRARVMQLAGDLANLELQIHSSEERFLRSRVHSLKVAKDRLYRDALKQYSTDERASKISRDYTRARASVFHLAKASNDAVDLAKQQIEIACLEAKLAKAKLDPTIALVELERQNSILVNLRKELAEQSSKAQAHVGKKLPTLINDYHLALGATGNIKDSRLLWDYRPFEPLYIHPKEVKPGGSGCTIVYNEPESKERLFEKFAIDRTDDKHDETVEMALSVVGTFGIRARETVADMLDKLFPGQTTAEIVKLVPELFDCIPKQLRLSSINRNSNTTSKTPSTSSTTTPPSSYYDEFEYMPDQIVLQCVPVSALLALLRAYLNTPNARSFLQVNRSLGGSATLFSLRSWDHDALD